MKLDKLLKSLIRRPRSNAKKSLWRLLGIKLTIVAAMVLFESHKAAYAAPMDPSQDSSQEGPVHIEVVAVSAGYEGAQAQQDFQSTEQSEKLPVEAIATADHIDAEQIDQGLAVVDQIEANQVNQNLADESQADPNQSGSNPADSAPSNQSTNPDEAVPPQQTNPNTDDDNPAEAVSQPSAAATDEADTGAQATAASGGGGEAQWPAGPDGVHNDAEGFFNPVNSGGGTTSLWSSAATIAGVGGGAAVAFSGTSTSTTDTNSDTNTPLPGIYTGTENNDIIQIATGKAVNQITGGAGDDKFVFTPDKAAQLHNIVDFNQNSVTEKDVIDLSKFASALSKYDQNHDHVFDQAEFAAFAQGTDNKTGTANVHVGETSTTITVNSGGAEEHDTVIQLQGVNHVEANNFIV